MSLERQTGEKLSCKSEKYRVPCHQRRKQAAEGRNVQSMETNAYKFDVLDQGKVIQADIISCKHGNEKVHHQCSKALHKIST